MKNVKTILQTNTGRNIKFQNIGNHQIMTRKEFVSKIENKNSAYHNDYVVKRINGIKTPVSKPDSSTKNNLG